MGVDMELYQFMGQAAGVGGAVDVALVQVAVQDGV